MSVSGLSLSGADIDNYTLTQPTLTADITKAALTVTADNKEITYGDALPTFTATPAGLVNGETLDSLGGVDFRRRFAVGGQPRHVHDHGQRPERFQLRDHLPDGTLTIDKAALTVTADNKEITYGDALPTFTATPAGLVNGDSLNSLGGVVFGGDSQTAVNHGTYTITASGLDDSNYAISYQDGTLIIDKATLTVTGITVDGKVYDGATGATLHLDSPMLVGVVNGEDVTLDSSLATGSFFSKNVGTWTVSVSGLSLSGADIDNYTLTQPTLTADITKAALTVTGITVDSKVYNGAADATLHLDSPMLAGVVNSEDVSLDSAKRDGAFAGADAGVGKLVTVSGLALSGADVGNYEFVQPTLTADITPATLTVTGLAAENKIYDGGTAATLDFGGVTLLGLIGGDSVLLDGGTADFTDKNVGLGKTVTVTGLDLTGDGDGKLRFGERLGQPDGGRHGEDADGQRRDGDGQGLRRDDGGGGRLRRSGAGGRGRQRRREPGRRRRERCVRERQCRCRQAGDRLRTGVERPGRRQLRVDRARA